MRRRDWPIALVLWMASQSGPVWTQQPAPVKRYRGIQVAELSAAEGAGLPPDYLVALEMELLGQLRRIKGCELVAREASRADLPQPALRITVVIRGLKAQGWSTRNLPQLVAHVRFLDQGTGRLLFETGLEGKKLVLAAAGDLDFATRGLAKKIADVTRRQFFR